MCLKLRLVHPDDDALQARAESHKPPVAIGPCRAIPHFCIYESRLESSLRQRWRDRKRNNRFSEDRAQGSFDRLHAERVFEVCGSMSTFLYDACPGAGVTSLGCV